MEDYFIIMAHPRQDNLFNILNAVIQNLTEELIVQEINNPLGRNLSLEKRF